MKKMRKNICSRYSSGCRFCRSKCTKAFSGIAQPDQSCPGTY